MAKPQARYVCQSCGAVTARWQGRCDACGAWNSIVEEREDRLPGAKAAAPRGRKVALENLSGDNTAPPRIGTGIAELDRVTGGGIVPGSAILVGGDPGIGKSTLLIQAAAALWKEGHRSVYISGEEATAQVRMRAERLGLSKAEVALAAITNVEDILATLGKTDPPSVIIIDSIQTMWTGTVDSAPGTVTQVRASAQAFIRYAKKHGSAVVLVGHVTKDGQIAGPRVVEHMVDAVLFFEGDGAHAFRILRTIKNRFGPTDEIGVFEMTGKGLAEVPNPSALFLTESRDAAPGSAVFAGMEGTRPILVELQALVAPTAYGTPRRAVVGWDSNRLAMVLAVLEARCGMRFSGQEVYLNVAGGLRLSEPAADLAVAAALISSLSHQPLPRDEVFFGEISLSGGIRPAAMTAPRLKEASKLGFRAANLASNTKREDDAPSLTLNRYETLNEFAGKIVGAGTGPAVQMPVEA